MKTERKLDSLLKKKHTEKKDVLVVVVGEGEVVVAGEQAGQPVEECKEEQHRRSHSLTVLRSFLISFSGSDVFLM